MGKHVDILKQLYKYHWNKIQLYKYHWNKEQKIYNKLKIFDDVSEKDRQFLYELRIYYLLKD